tara:strand:- start:1191 stop:1388 length:198 start_codon:yes stop_codon:yes gene_type:complete
MDAGLSLWMKEQREKDRAKYDGRNKSTKPRGQRPVHLYGSLYATQEQVDRTSKALVDSAIAMMRY